MIQSVMGCRAADNFDITIIAANSPAADAGLKPGDRIISIDATPVSQLAPADALAIFSVPEGTNRNPQVLPKEGGESQVRRFQLKELLP